MADKCDLGYVISRVNENTLNGLMKVLQEQRGKMNIQMKRTPNFVLDIYKNRRGQYKSVRIWIYLDLGTGEREDLFITNSDNMPIGQDIDTYTIYTETLIEE